MLDTPDNVLNSNQKQIRNNIKKLQKERIDLISKLISACKK
jgi:hypothetical protein